MQYDEDQYWEGRLIETRRSQLDTVQKSARGWSTLFAAVLGAFGSVTFVSGLAGLDELPPSLRIAVQWLVAFAACTTLAATILAGLAANVLPAPSDDATSLGLRSETKLRAKKALRRLRAAIWLGVLAALCVISGSMAVLFAPADGHSSAPTYLVAVVGGRAFCGAGATGPSGELSIGGVVFRDVDSISIVPRCP